MTENPFTSLDEFKVCLFVTVFLTFKMGKTKLNKEADLQNA